MFAGAYDGFGLARQHAGRGYDLRIWENFIVFFYGSVAHCGDCVLQDWFHEHKPSVAPHFRPYVPDALPTQWYKDFEENGNEDSMWEMWFIHYMHVEQVIDVENGFYRTELCYRGICRRRVSVCVCVCHTPALYQNG